MTASRPMRRDAVRNREAIVTAAIAVLAAEPGATMQEIADASEIGRTTLYRHFPDRESLVVAIDARVHTEADETVDAALDTAAGGDPVRVIAQLAAELAGLGDRYRFLQRHATTRPVGDDPAPSGARGRLLAFIVDAQRAGAVRSDLPADWLLDAVAAIITRAATRRADEAPARARMVVRTISSLLATPPA